MITTFEERLAAGGWQALHEASLQLTTDDALCRAVRGLSRRLDRLCIPHAFAGGVARAMHGCLWLTAQIDVAIDADLADVVSRLGDGWSVHGNAVVSEVLGVPVSIRRATTPLNTVTIDGIRCFDVPSLIDRALSGAGEGISRLGAEVVVIETIRKLRLPASFATNLSPGHREAFARLWQGLAEYVEPEGWS